MTKKPMSVIKLDNMVTAGLRAIDLFAIAREDILLREHLRTFLKAALAAKDAKS